MSLIAIDPVCRRRLQPNVTCRLGQIVSAQHQQSMAELANQIAFYRTPKQFFRSTGDVTTSTSSKVWRFGGHIGPMTRTIVARILMGQSNQSLQTNNPRVQLAIYNTSGTQLAQASAHYGYAYGNTPNNDPSEWGAVSIAIDVSSYRDTSFRAQLIASEEAIPISCIVHEVPLRPDTDNGYVNPQCSVGTTILDSDRSALQDLAVDIYKRGGPTLWAYSSDTDATAPTSTSASYQGLFYLSGAPESDLQGFQIDQRYCNRKTGATVPVKIDCYAGISASSGNVRVVDSLGNVYATIAVSGSAAWQTTATADLPADNRMYVAEHQSNGVATITTYAVSVFCYQD